MIVMTSLGKLTARRERGTINPLSNMDHGGKWVVRDAEGTWIDADKYRNDLRERYPGLTVIGD